LVFELISSINLNPLGFSNLNTSGLSDNYVLESRGINTALILITVGSNPREKNVNIIFSTVKTGNKDHSC